MNELQKQIREKLLHGLDDNFNAYIQKDEDEYKVSVRYVNNRYHLIPPAFLETKSITSVIMNDNLIDMTIKDVATMINKYDKNSIKKWYSLELNDEVDFYNIDAISDFESGFVIVIEK